MGARSVKGADVEVEDGGDEQVFLLFVVFGAGEEVSDASAAILDDEFVAVGGGFEGSMNELEESDHLVVLVSKSLDFGREGGAEFDHRGRL